MRVMIKKSVADYVQRRWGYPVLLLKANPHHDERGRFARGGNTKSPYDGVDMNRLRAVFNEKTDPYIGKTITNKATGLSVVFTKSSRKNIRSHTKSSVEINHFTPYEHFEVANQVIDLFENATLENEHSDVKYNRLGLRMERFLSQPVKLKSGREVQACISVKHSLNSEGRRIYALEAIGIKEALEKTRAKGRQLDKPEDTPRISNIPQRTEKSSTHTRLVIQRSVADEIMRWCYPRLLLKVVDQPRDERGRFASKGGAASAQGKDELFGFASQKLTRSQCRQLAKRCCRARADAACVIDPSDIAGSAEKYLHTLLVESNDSDRWICSPLFGGARVRFNGDSLRHFFNSKRERRSVEEIERRAKCLPFIKDILRESGMKGSASYNEKGMLAFTVIGRAQIDGRDTAIRVVVSKKSGRKYFYLSVNNLDGI